MSAAVVDTNVPVVANGRAVHADPACVMSCIAALRRIIAGEMIVLDDGRRILNEYLRQGLSFAGQPGAGDAFFKWVWDNQANGTRCEMVTIHETDRGFAEFPADSDLMGFDRSDRKFVAAAIASRNNPRILNAVDSDWWNFRGPLLRHGIVVDFICPEQFR